MNPQPTSYVKSFEYYVLKSWDSSWTFAKVLKVKIETFSPMENWKLFSPLAQEEVSQQQESPLNLKMIKLKVSEKMFWLEIKDIVTVMTQAAYASYHVF